MELKKCSKCKEDKELLNFYLREKNSNKYSNECKLCQKITTHNSYLKHKEKIIEKTLKNKKETKDWFYNLKSKLKCEKCGFSNYIALDFHHLDPSKKDRGIPYLLSTCNKKKILKEIEKCIVLCSNCHRILHYEEKNGRVSD